MSREKFEELPEIKERRKLCFYDDDSNQYVPRTWVDYGSSAYLNGAWFAWQEQQKRIEDLETELRQWKGKSIAAIIHGSCECGEPWQSVPTNKEGFNQLHCFNCGKDRYENKEVFGDDEPCKHFSTTMFHDGKAECFQCNAIVNEKREIIGQQSKGLFSKESEP